ncbi:MAG: hypothetical protein JWP42_4007 [Pseudomonas sp.]|nr:hypothetical protein [Pseudomonas sp.]
MSILNLKWVQGAPKEYLVGMVIRMDGGEIKLIGHCSDIGFLVSGDWEVQEHAQAIQSYELNWLNNMGVPAKVIA